MTRTPPPTPVVVAALKALPVVTEQSTKVSTRLLSPLPAIRVAKVGDAETPSASSIAPLFQIEVWDEDELETERIAWRLADEWPTAIPGVSGGGYVHGRWVHINPSPSPDPETGQARHILTVGLRISGVIS